MVSRIAVTAPVAFPRTDRLLREVAFEGSPWFSRHGLSVLFEQRRVTKTDPHGRPRILIPASPCAEGDVIHLELPGPINTKGLLPASTPATPIHISKRFAVFNKPPGTHTYPLEPWANDCFANMIAKHLDDANLMSVDDFSALATPPVNEGGLVQRLDQNTSGLVISALDPAAKKAFRAAFSAETFIQRRYLAIVRKEPQVPEIHRVTLEGGKFSEFRFFIWHTGSKLLSQLRRPHFQDDTPVTKVFLGIRILSSARGRYLVEVDSRVGHRHVVRLGLMSLRSPVMGDPVYGPEHRTDKDQFSLHASGLRIASTIRDDNNEVVALDNTVFTCPPPQSFLDLASSYLLKVTPDAWENLRQGPGQYAYVIPKSHR
eukprot:m.238244 g.238244  ORF g.238244 m.238244 type:complete len:373 (-) comp13274_c0_seq1:429-1547(-)